MIGIKGGEEKRKTGKGGSLAITKTHNISSAIVSRAMDLFVPSSPCGGIILVGHAFVDVLLCGAGKDGEVEIAGRDSDL